MADIETKKISPVAENWRGPTIREIAKVSGVATATVDRVLNGRPGVREKTRTRVLAALEEIGHGLGAVALPERRRIAFLTDSGSSFNEALQDAVNRHIAANPTIECTFTGMATAAVKPVQFAQLIERTAESVEGLVVVCREDVMINRAVRAVMGRGVPVVCLANDVPSSNRLAYVGSDQVAAGATAAYLMGSVLRNTAGKILLVYSAPYRGQAEREMGFRSALRSEFSLLEIDERVNSNDDSEYSYKNIRKYIEDHGPPVGIYNVGAGNVGIAKALKDEGLKGKVVFIGHELTANTRMLLETGGMNFAIGHDLDIEVAQSIAVLEAAFAGRTDVSFPLTPVRVYTKYNCL